MSKELADLRQSVDADVLQLIEDWESPSKPEKPKNVTEVIERLKAEPSAEARSSFLDYKDKAQRLEKLKRLSPAEIVELTVIDRYEEVFGRVDSVLEELDRRSTRSLRFASDGIRPPDKMLRNLTEYVTDGIYVRLGQAKSSRFTSEDAAQLIVTSPSAGWTRSSFARIGDEIEKGVPKWAFLRLPAFRLLLGALYFIAPTLAVAIAVGLDTKSAAWVFAAGGALAFISGLTELTAKITDWMLPAFEVLQDGSQPAGTRRLLTLVGILVTIPVGIFVNQIS
ncbi:hypothetical protein [Micromonospora fulviviridis]|uniref:hypothetical protein n=1 Tax=Micromonospora fulviviridis TaxID=47860 RepID=UPI00378D92AF